MKRALMLLLSTCLVTSCGHVSVSSQPPNAYVIVGGNKFQTKINGYEWTSLTGTSVADAAFDPAKNLTPISGDGGTTVHLSFQSRPETIQLDMWRNGSKLRKQTLNSTTFALPNKAGDYIYEITGNWGKEYVQYDFEVRVR